jgi:hypothetical protein
LVYQDSLLALENGGGGRMLWPARKGKGEADHDLTAMRCEPAAQQQWGEKQKCEVKAIIAVAG